MAEKIIQQQSKAGDNLYPVIHADSIPADAVTTEKVKDNSVTEPKLSAELDKKITDSKTVTDTLMEGLKDPDHLEDPFVRAGLIPIPFEDPVVKKVLVDNYSTTGDGELWYKDAENMDSIGWSSKGGFTLQGNKDVRHFREYRFFPKASFQPMFFKDCINLEDIEFPEGKKSLDYSYVFEGCTSLKLDHLSDDIESIAHSYFHNCDLTLTKLPDNLKSLEPHAIGGCVKCDITVAPKGITVLQENNWGGNTSLISRHLTVLSPTITYLGYRVFADYDWIAFEACTTPPPIDSDHNALGTDAIVYVPDDAVDTYKGATNWKDLGDRIKPLSEKPATT